MKRKRIENLAELKARCVEIGECWHWAYTPGLVPKVTPLIRFQGRHCQVPRVAFMLLHGLNHDDLEGLMVWPACGNRACVRPEHTRSGSKSDYQRWRAANGLNRISLVAVANITKGVRTQRGVKFTMDEVRAIRAATTSEKQEAENRSCSANLIGQIRRGQLYRESVATASVFSVGARAMEPA